MKLSADAKKIYNQINSDSTKLGDLKKLAKQIKTDHELALELWSTGEYHPRLLSTLIMDKKLLTQEFIESLATDLEGQGEDESTRIMEWIIANQLTKSKKTIELMLSWANHPSALLRRTFWYYQGRLRWTGQTPPDNTAELVSAIESKLADEEPEVQWAMNFTAAWIGVFDKRFRDRCIRIGETTGLYKEEKVPKGCTPNYLPAFIEIEAGKRKLN